MANKEVKEALKKSKVRQWQVAEVLEMNEFVFSRKMRHELPEEEKNLILETIKKLQKETK